MLPPDIIEYIALDLNCYELLFINKEMYSIYKYYWCNNKEMIEHLTEYNSHGKTNLIIKIYFIKNEITQESNNKIFDYICRPMKELHTTSNLKKIICDIENKHSRCFFNKPYQICELRSIRIIVYDVTSKFTIGRHGDFFLVYILIRQLQKHIK